MQTIPAGRACDFDFEAKPMLWVIGAALIALWFLLRFILHKGGGFAHILLLTGISLLIIQVAAYRKARYQRLSSRR